MARLPKGPALAGLLRMRRPGGSTPSAPVNTVKPAISGSPVVGATLTASTGTWTGSPTSYTYQWKENGVSISGATNSSFVLTVDQTGDSITVTVTANNGQTASVTSDPVGPVTAPFSGAFNPSAPVTGFTLTESNARVTNTSGGAVTGFAKAPAAQALATRKVWAVEIVAAPDLSGVSNGFCEAAATNTGVLLSVGGFAWVADGSLFYNSTQVGTAVLTWGLNDKLMFDWDPSTGAVRIGKNGTWHNSGNAVYTVAAPTTTRVPASAPRRNNDSFRLIAWPYAVPSGASKWME